MSSHASEAPAKKQSKWSAEEDRVIIELRGSGMKWEDISKRLPGRSPISCRLHYQNYLERRSPWDEERKNKLARLYERFKPEMWAKVAEELQIPWRAAEAMHWQLGEQEMAHRAGVTPFLLTATTMETSQPGLRVSPRGGHVHSQSQGSISRDMLAPSRAYGRGTTPLRQDRPLATRREPGPPPVSVKLEQVEQPVYAPPPPPPPPLAPIQTQGQPQPRLLPSLAELTTGVSPYSTPAYSVGIPSASPSYRTGVSPAPYLPAPTTGHSVLEPTRSKRRHSPDIGLPEPRTRRHLDPREEQSIPRHMP